LKLAKAPAILIEYGFMDSRVDYPIIASEEYAKAVGYATADAIAKVAGLEKKNPAEPKILYCVQAGRYPQKNHAETVLKALKNDGYDAIIKEEIVE
jgi:hypothetical protein